MGEVLELKFDTRMQCGGCGQMRDLHEWYWRKGPPLRLSSKVCKECTRNRQNEAQKQRYNADPEWREKYNAYQKAYREQKRGCYSPAMQKIREQRHKQRNPDSDRLKKIRWYRKNVARRLWYGARGRAKSAGLEFSLSLEWIQAKLDGGKCEGTGLPFVASEKKGRCAPFSPSIDRRDSGKGYTPENCRMILWALNMALSEWGDEVYELVARAYLERL